MEAGMRRITVPLGSLAAAAMLSLALPGTAHAAKGSIVIDNRDFSNPSGCYHMSSSVTNKTAQTVNILSGPGCTGELAVAVPPGQSVTYDPGDSVWID
jgi:hypothetical protein